MKKVVLITGASSGIGNAIANYLHNKNFIVYGTSRNAENYKNIKFNLISLDVRNKESIQNAVNHIIDKEKSIDILINNAGVGITGALEEIPIEEIKNNFETNFFGPIEVIKAVLPYMRQNKNGLIINITSIAAYMGLPFRSIYSASKSALSITTEALRMELKPYNIKVCNVAPGDFATNIASGRYHAPVNENSPYYTTYGGSLQMMNEHVDKGLDTNKMAKTIYNIIENKDVKIHYKVGLFMQKFSVLLKCILPNNWFEKLLIKHYKL